MTQLKSDLITAAGAAMLVGAAVSAEMAWLAARGVAELGVPHEASAGFFEVKPPQPGRLRPGCGL